MRIDKNEDKDSREGFLSWCRGRSRGGAGGRAAERPGGNRGRAETESPHQKGPLRGHVGGDEDHDRARGRRDRCVPGPPHQGPAPPGVS